MKRAAELTKWREISPLEFYISVKSQDSSAKWHEINKCPICMCELFDDIETNEEETDPKKMHEETMQKIQKAQ